MSAGGWLFLLFSANNSIFATKAVTALTEAKVTHILTVMAEKVILPSKLQVNHRIVRADDKPDQVWSFLAYLFIYFTSESYMRISYATSVRHIRSLANAWRMVALSSYTVPWVYRE